GDPPRTPRRSPCRRSSAAGCRAHAEAPAGAASTGRVARRRGRRHRPRPRRAWHSTRRSWNRSSLGTRVGVNRTPRRLATRNDPCHPDRMRWTVAMIAVVFAAGRSVASSGPVPCAETPFISDVPLSTDAAHIVVVDAGGQVTIPGLCGPILARWRSRPGKRGVVRATWPSCGTATRVRLRMRYAPDCTTADGFFKSRGAPRIVFTAAPSRCGDDYLGAGEACELSSPCPTAGDTCTDCQCVPSASSTTTTTTPGGTTSTTLAGLFEAPNPWNQDVSALPVAPESSTIIGALAAGGGWGTGSTALQIDFSIHLLHASPTTMRLTFAPNGGYYLPDCDDPFPFPLPAGGAVEGESGYDCTSG